MKKYDGISKKNFRRKKLLLPYFIKFEEDDRILHKKYSDNYIIKGPDWQPIIMITYNKSIFFANNSQ